MIVENYTDRAMTYFIGNKTFNFSPGACIEVTDVEAIYLLREYSDVLRPKKQAILIDSKSDNQDNLLVEQPKPRRRSRKNK